MYIWPELVSQKDEFENARFDTLLYAYPYANERKRHKLRLRPSASEMLRLAEDDDRSFSAFRVSFSSSCCLLRERIVFRNFTRSLGL